MVHGLMAEWRKVKDGEPPVAQAYFERLGALRAQDDRTRIIGSTVGKRSGGTSQDFKVERRAARDDSNDTAHEL
jgi:hypothetical protein